ncbi:MAG: FISUMP domain-containing protein, partial [Bacilli bacterium]|nr:FISUMP domain-containing protein [Bacilli bacterium]
ENDANIDYIIVKDGDCVEVIYKPPFPCGEDLVDARDNNTYQTAQFGDQCWMTENLKYTGNGCLSKTWDSSAPHDACMANGAEIHYQWKAAMNEETRGEDETDKVIQGLCPEGWHIPTDDEWKVLEGTVDKEYGVGHTEWDKTGWRGSDAGTTLKGSLFNAKLAGFRDASGSLDNVGSYGYWWTSSPVGSSAWGRSMLSSNSGVRRITLSQAFGYSVRCVSEQ